MGSVIVEQDFPHDINHRGARDAQRHNKRVDEAVKKQLKDIISSENIITSEGNKKIKVRLKYLDQFRFVYGKDRVDKVGRDNYDELSDGEIIYKPPTGGEVGPKAGDELGEEVYEEEYTIQELTDLMIETLELPDLDDTKKNEIFSEIMEWTDRRKKTGISACLDKRATLKANLLRKAKTKLTTKLRIDGDDLRYKTWEIHKERHSNAVVFLMIDRSGSMYEEKIYAVKALYFWIVQFLKRKYKKVDIRFIAHDVAAKEMNERDFFSIADSGGTLVSTAYNLCRDIIKHNYPISEWNIYCFHASDGDSWDDEDECVAAIQDIIRLGAKLFAYAEVDMDGRSENSTLMKKFETLAKKNDAIIISTIQDDADILASIKKFLRHSARKNLEKA